MLCYFGSGKLRVLQITIGYEHCPSVWMTVSCFQTTTNTVRVRIIPTELQSVSSFLSPDLFLIANVTCK